MVSSEVQISVWCTV